MKKLIDTRLIIYFLVVGFLLPNLTFADGIFESIIPDQTTAELTDFSITATTTVRSETLQFSLDATAPAGATITPTGSGDVVFDWTPTEVQGPGTYPITIYVFDGEATSSTTFTIDVSEVNTPPSSFEQVSTTTEEGLSKTIFLPNTDSDLPAQTLTFATTSNPSNGTLVQVSGNEFIYTPNPGYFTIDNPDSFSYEVSDGVASSTSNVSITVDQDTTFPSSIISTPVSNASIQAHFITISGTTTDDVGVASTTLAFAPYITSLQLNNDIQSITDVAPSCGTYTDTVSLINPTATSTFEWTYDWTPPADGTYCIEVYGQDINGNNEIDSDSQLFTVKNVDFTKTVPAVPPTPPVVGGNGPVVGFAGGGGGGGVSVPNNPAPSVPSPSPAPALPPKQEPQSVDIVWSTNIQATSQVAYGLTANGPYVLNPNKANFGYTFSTPEDTAKVLNHSVTIPDVMVGQSYSVRVVSRASTPTFGPEYKFTLNADGTIKTEGAFGGEIIIQDNSVNTNTNTQTLKDIININKIKIEQMQSASTTTNNTNSENSNQTATVSLGAKTSWTSFIGGFFSKILSWFGRK